MPSKSSGFAPRRRYTGMGFVVAFLRHWQGAVAGWVRITRSIWVKRRAAWLMFQAWKSQPLDRLWCGAMGSARHGASICKRAGRCRIRRMEVLHRGVGRARQRFELAARYPWHFTGLALSCS
jgi:hypothetical protein